METIINAKGKKACHVYIDRRMVEVMNKNFKVTVEFLDNGKVEIIRFNEDGTIADKEILEATA